jgi:hypothetical protein
MLLKKVRDNATVNGRFIMHLFIVASCAYAVRGSNNRQ